MEYLKLSDYQDIAKKLLNKSFPKVAQTILKDNDKFGEVVDAIITADWKFNGKGNLYGYRKQRVQWAIWGLGSNKEPELSLNFHIADDMEMSETIPDRTEFDSVEHKDMLAYLRDKVTNSKVLTEKEKVCISQYLTENVELGEIANNLDIHKEAVKTSVRRGLSKLGLYNEYTQRFRSRKDSRRKS